MKAHNHPTSIVIFGGTGDLAQTKLLPALLDLYVAGKLPDSFVIIGLSRKELRHDDYQKFFQKSIDEKGHSHEPADVSAFCARLRYVSGNLDDLEAYERIKSTLSESDAEIGPCTNKLFYLAVPPSFYATIFSKLKESNAMALCDGVGSWSRLLVEKPFGRDLETAQALEAQLCELFKEEQIYRIDHYLAKSAIENIISLRFANSILANAWNGDQIESIAVRLFESKDVSNRGSFYDGIGALRDVGQNHMLQMLALLTMKRVDVHDANAVRDARAEALQALTLRAPENIIRAQYDGFVDVEGVAPNSETETYFKIETTMQDEVLKGVQVILESGKALHTSTAEAVVTFKNENICSCSHEDGQHSHKNVLTITFSPEHEIKLSMWVKKPSFAFLLEERELVLTHTTGTDAYSPEAYERVLYDCIAGDQTRFVSGAEVMEAWKFITPILEAFQSLPLHTYAPASTGPHV